MNKESLQSRENWNALARLKMSIRVNQAAGDRLDEVYAEVLGIGRADARALDVLHRLGPMSAGALGQEAGLTSGAMTALIDRLERAGYVQRKPDPADRRRVLVKVTDKTEEIVALIFHRYADIGRELMTEFTREDLAKITRFNLIAAEMSLAMVTRLTAVLDEAKGMEPTELARIFSERFIAEVATINAGLADAVADAEARLAALDE